MVSTVEMSSQVGKGTRFSMGSQNSAAPSGLCDLSFGLLMGKLGTPIPTTHGCGEAQLMIGCVQGAQRWRKFLPPLLQVPGRCASARGTTVHHIRDHTLPHPHLQRRAGDSAATGRCQPVSKLHILNPASQKIPWAGRRLRCARLCPGPGGQKRGGGSALKRLKPGPAEDFSRG